MLPSERENRQHVKTVLRQEFKLSKLTLDLAIEVLKKLLVAEREDIPFAAKGTIAGILTREIRRLRSIAVIGELGHLENVEALTRSMFEGLLAERFVLQKPLHWRKRSKGLSTAVKACPRIPSRCNATEFRALLYANYETLKIAQLARRVAEDIPTDAFERIERAEADAKALIGKAWLKHMKDTRSFSGISIYLLAESCGLRNYYTQIYGVQCIKSHSNDPLAYLCVDVERVVIVAQVATDDRGLAQLGTALGIACCVGHLLLNDLNDVFELGMIDELADAVHVARKVSSMRDVPESDST